MKQQFLFVRYTTLGKMFGPFLVGENLWIKTILILNELKKLEGNCLYDDVFAFVQEVFFAEKHKTLEDISIQILQMRCGSFNHLDFINQERLETVPFNFWAVINGNQLYKFSEKEIKNIEGNLPEYY